MTRRAVLWYSIRNRNRKAVMISEWMKLNGCHTVLFVGASGDEHLDDPNMANVGLVEKILMSQFEVKMGINIYEAKTSYPFTIADARDLPFEEDYVDFALANAIIEHVGGESDQAKMVAEMTRVARCWVITTPNRWFPVESHTSAILLHWIPSWRRKHIAEFTRLLSRGQLRALLPEGARIEGRLWSPTFTAYYCKNSEQWRS